MPQQNEKQRFLANWWKISTGASSAEIRAGNIRLSSPTLLSLPRKVEVTMTIQLNGEERNVPEGLTLAGLLDWLELAADRVAVERNQEIVKRSAWNATAIEEGRPP